MQRTIGTVVVVVVMQANMTYATRIAEWLLLLLLLPVPLRRLVTRQLLVVMQRVITRKGGGVVGGGGGGGRGGSVVGSVGSVAVVVRHGHHALVYRVHHL